MTTSTGIPDGWTCRHDRQMQPNDFCTICWYDLPLHMRNITDPVKRLQARKYLDERYQSVRKFGGGRKRTMDTRYK